MELGVLSFDDAKAVRNMLLSVGHEAKKKLSELDVEYLGESKYFMWLTLDIKAMEGCIRKSI